MLFDLKGKRRRMVQVTYLGLAILIGLGLIGFGVGSSINGGLGDIFSGGSGGSNSATQAIQSQVDAANRQLRVNPHDQAALKQLIRSHYQLATAQENASTNVFNAKGRQQLAQAAAAWNRYLAETSKPDPAVAALMLQAFQPGALGDLTQATKAAEIVASSQGTSQAWVNVVLYASAARDTRTIDVASRQALAVAPASQRATVKQQISQAKSAGASAAVQAGGKSAQP